MLCAKYQEAGLCGLCGSREKCDRNYLVSKFAHVHNIQSRGQTGSGHAADSNTGNDSCTAKLSAIGVSFTGPRR